MSKSSRPYRELMLDFEFSGVNEPKVKLVSCSTYNLETGKKIKWWLFKDPKRQAELLAYLKKFECLIGYSCIAEARSVIALGADPLDWEWEDLFLEYRMLTNHNNELQWGKQLVDGKVKFVRKPKPKWERTEDDIGMGFRPTHSLAEATYKLTGEIRDTEHKNKMRDLIISYPEKFTSGEREAILEYNMDDVVFLDRIREEIKKHFVKLVLPSRRREGFVDMLEYKREARARGRYAAHTAWMENNGYPIDVEATRNFSHSVANIIFDTQREINQLFPEIKPFRWNRANNCFSWDQKKTKEWINDHHDPAKWMKTDGGDLSLSLEAFERFYPFKHDYPKDNFGAQMVRFLKLKQSLYGFVPPQNKKSGKKTFWDYVGPDGRVRPYMNIFGAQSSRSQPAATGFMFLKPAWMRALVKPAPGKFMAGIDYGQQEFFVAGLQSRDKVMIDAYLSGDPYLAFAKMTKMVPMNATKDSHKFERDLCKSTILGISYLMTKYGLSTKLTNDTGRVWTEDEAQDQIDLFYDTFSDLFDAQQQLMEDYGDTIDFIKLPCGWYMWGDNENIRSVVNVPVQGTGASVMRKAIDLNHARGGAYVPFTLHDAIYIEGRVGEEHKIAILRDAMRDAFVSFFPDYKKEAAKIKLDPFAWSPEYERDSELVVKHNGESWRIPCSDVYLDPRAESDYHRFCKYFEKPVEDLV